MAKTSTDDQRAFIAEIRTRDTGAEQIDVVILKNGRIIALTPRSVVVYDNAEAFDAAAPRGVVDRGAGPVSP